MHTETRQTLPASRPVRAATSLVELNRRFLELMCVRLNMAKLDGCLGLPAEFGPRIGRLSANERAAVADCPFALFDVRFRDEMHWHVRLQSPAWQISDAPPGDWIANDFVRIAVFFAWHLSIMDPLSARLVLGLRRTTVEEFQTVTLDRLSAIAVAEQRYLSVRWQERPRFWLALTEAAAGTRGSRLRRVQLHGLQFAAADCLPETRASSRFR
jgi:hypothetical protein